MANPFPLRTALFPAGTLAPADFKVELAKWYDAHVALSGNAGPVAPPNVATAATVDLSTQTTRHVIFTGTTPVVDFTIPAGWIFFVEAGGAFPLTNGAPIVTKTGADIYCRAGDSFWVRATADNVVEILGFVQARRVGAINILVRQTVLSGPVDTSGLSAFGGSTGSATVTVGGTLTVAAANGFNADGPVDRVGQILNPSWTALSTNGTMYLYLDVAADGSCTTGSGTLGPNYRWGGADVVTNGQFTFNIQEMTGKVGNGSAAAQAYRVYVGEVTVAGGVVTAITWYALMGRYNSGWFAVASNQTYNKSSKLGTNIDLRKVQCLYRQSSSYVPRVLAVVYEAAGGQTYGGVAGPIDRNTARIRTGTGGVGALTVDLSTPFGANDGATIATGEYLLTDERGW